MINALPSAARDSDAVFRQFGGPVYAYAKAAGAEDCEDILGDVFVAVVRGIGKFHGDDDALRRWIFTIAHHRIVDERRRAARHRHVMRAATGGLAAAPDDPFDPVLLAALAALTLDQREVVVLRFIGDMSLEDVAALTGRPVGAVKSLQHRGLRNLAAAMAKEKTSAA